MNDLVETLEAVERSHRLRLLSYNIQAGVDTSRYRQYLTQSWKQVLPHRQRQANLNEIARMLTAFDLVGLQEVDSGSLRSGFVDQTEYLAHRAAFPHWFKQINRSLGKFAQHSNGFLSRLRPSVITEHKLPGLPGRGAILVEFGNNVEKGLAVCIVHLALGRRAQIRQLGYIGEMVSEYPNLILMGDLNCDCDSVPLRSLIRKADLREPSCELKTFPSWRPRHNLDHILVSSALEVAHVRVLDYTFSDHLPLAMDVLLPKRVRLAA